MEDILSRTPQHAEIIISTFDKTERVTCGLPDVHNPQPQRKLNLIHPTQRTEIYSDYTGNDVTVTDATISTTKCQIDIKIK